MYMLVFIYTGICTCWYLLVFSHTGIAISCWYLFMLIMAFTHASIYSYFILVFVCSDIYSYIIFIPPIISQHIINPNTILEVGSLSYKPQKHNVRKR